MEYNKEKFKNVVLYIARHGGSDVGKKKLAKILYFIDFTLYELKKRSLTGMIYTRKNYGPMPEPTIFYLALRELKQEGIIDIDEMEIEKNRGVRLDKIIPKQEVDIQVFDKDEKEVLHQMVEKYRLETAGNLERLAQSEPPYKMVKYGEEIPYHLSFYRNSFGEMDLDD